MVWSITERLKERVEGPWPSGTGSLPRVKAWELEEGELEAGKRGGLAGVGMDRPHGLRALREGRGKGF